MNIKIKDIELFMKHPHLFGHYLGYDKLVPLHSKWIKEAWLHNDWKALQAHRNSYKTTSIIIVGAIWYLLFINPDATILYIRKIADDAGKVIGTIRDHLESKEICLIAKFIYNIEDLRTDNWSNKSLTLAIKQTKTPEGNIDSRGITGTMTGSHYDIILADDIVDLKDRVSKIEREKTKNYVREFTNLKKKDGKIFYSGTPWHKDDVWSILPEPVKYPIGTVPIIGYFGNDLDETKKELRLSLTSSLYAINYELKHIADEGRIFGEPQFDNWPEQAKRIIAYLDPSYKGSNTTALSMIAEMDGKYHIRGWVWPNDVTELYDPIVSCLKSYKCGTLYVEENADKGSSKRDLQKLYPAVEGVIEKENKHIRIITYVKQNWNKLYFAHDCQSEYLNQILDYEEGLEPDDAPDSAAGLLRVFSRETTGGPDPSKLRDRRFRSAVLNLPR